MPVNVVVQSNQGTFQGGTFVLGPVVISSGFSSLAVVSLSFASALFQASASPAGSFGVLIEPPSSNLVGLTLKGPTGDVGIPIGTNSPSLLSFGNPAISNSVGLTSAGAIAGVVTVTFF